MAVVVASGRQYDEEGRLKDWWDPHSTENFGITTKCMVQQYSDMLVKGQRVRSAHRHPLQLARRYYCCYCYYYYYCYAYY